MTWKYRQRNKVPSVDLEDNPFCVERRVNEERHLIKLNRNPSLAHMTSADITRATSFTVDDEKPFREFSRRKRHLLASSLRAASAPRKGRDKHVQKERCRSSAIPSQPEAVEMEEFFEHPKSSRRCRRRRDVDIDTAPALEPYRREVVAQQPITFGHRPVSASRMFNPSTMATSFGSCSGSSIVGGDVSKQGTSRGVRSMQEDASSKKISGKARRAPGLSAPMLKELLRGNGQIGHGLTELSHSATAVAHLRGDACQDTLKSQGGGVRRDSANENCLVLDKEEAMSETSNRSMWGSVDPTSSSVAWGDSGAKLLAPSSRQGVRQGRGDTGDSTDETELRRIFSDTRRPWDGTPAPIPAPRENRRAISSLLLPDPDERLRDKIAKSRKAAAGIPVTASSIQDEKLKNAWPETSSDRWDVPPATPRAVIASEELKRLVDSRRQRDSCMARRVRQAELSVLYNKIARSEDLYRSTLARGMRHHGVPAK